MIRLIAEKDDKFSVMDGLKIVVAGAEESKAVRALEDMGVSYFEVEDALIALNSKRHTIAHFGRGVLVSTV